MSKRAGQGADSEWYRSYFSEPYGEIYADYLLPPEMTRQEAELAQHALGLSPEDVILDCPCGYGRHAASLLKDYPNIFGLDLDADCLKRAKQHLAEAPLVQGDMRVLPFQSKSFHAILHLFNSFGYFSEEENLTVLQEFARILKPGGKVLIDVANPEPLADVVKDNPRTMQYVLDMVLTEDWNYSKRAKRITNQTHIKIGGKEYQRSYSVRLYSLPEFRSMFKKTGFTVEKVYGEMDGSAYDAAESNRLIVVGRRAS